MSVTTAGPAGTAIRYQRRTVDERDARGRSAREAAPRSAPGQWQPAADRPDPVALLADQSKGRVAELVPVRYGRMLLSPFTFYRGAAAIMAADLAKMPRSGIDVQLCGDAHLSNFGVFGTPERKMIFDLNDFDETLPGPWEWDLMRLAASFEIMGRSRGFAAADRRAIVLTAAREYRKRMRAAARMGTLAAWYEDLDIGQLMKMVKAEVRARPGARPEARRALRNARQARTRDSARVYAKRAADVGGEPRIMADPPLIVPMEDLVEPGSEWEHADLTFDDLIGEYRRTLGRSHHPIEEFHFVHAARKVVGVGSVGTRCFILLFLGRDRDDPLFLQVKEAGPSVLERYLGPGGYASHGERVVVGQRLMQAATDIFLGWVSARGLDGQRRDFYVRQFQDWKGSADVDNLRLSGATVYARICGATLARAHARWGDRIAIASYLGRGGKFDAAVADFSAAYADQNERDYDAFSAAVKSGRLPVQTGV
jgi:uncharacterized protein (DUF2252 family)